MKFVIFAFTVLLVAAPSAHADGSRNWRTKCASCHGADGKGDTDQGKKLKLRDQSSAAWQKEFTDEKIKLAINEGINTERDGVKKVMSPFKDKLKPADVDDLVKFTRTLAK